MLCVAASGCSDENLLLSLVWTLLWCELDAGRHRSHLFRCQDASVHCIYFKVQVAPASPECCDF